MMKTFLKILGLLFLTIILFIVISMIKSVNKKSGYSNCVIAKSSESFIGKNLKFQGEAERKTLKTESCVELDRDLDRADGAKKGRVR